LNDYVEIELMKGQAGFEGMSYCPECKKFIKKEEDSVRIEINDHFEWIHLACFIQICKPILDKVGYSTNPSRRDAPH
jgi:hypothetical protein